MEESRVLRHVKPPRCEEASRMPHARIWNRNQAIVPLDHSFTHGATRAPILTLTYVFLYGFYGIYNCYGLVRQVLGFITVSVSAYRTCRNLDC